MLIREKFFPVRDYDLAATLTSGQVFRWQLRDGAWEGVIGQRWARLHGRDGGILAQTAQAEAGWNWLTDYLQIAVDLSAVLLSFPDDDPMRRSVTACRGLRLLRQDPWECLASFILSSTKQIIQIQQIVALLCARFGQPILAPDGHEPLFSFPGPERLAVCSETDLRDCKMGFRAPYLLQTARMLVSGEVNLLGLRHSTADAARDQLLKLPGVGIKIANCVLLFAYGFQSAFPVDVWIMKALRQLYFPRRRISLRRVQKFTATHFGRNAGYAQQYLFHYMRTKGRS
jgi:N-glycosylase/DNA lyase